MGINEENEELAVFVVTKDLATFNPADDYVGYEKGVRPCFVEESARKCSAI